MIDSEHPSPIHFHFNGRLVAARKPKTANSLILSDKVGSIDPKGRFFSRVPGDFHNREVVGIDPYFPLEQILVFAFRSGFENEAMIRALYRYANQFAKRSNKMSYSITPIRVVRAMPQSLCIVLLLTCGARSAERRASRSEYCSGSRCLGRWFWLEGVYDILVKDGYNFSIVQEPETSLPDGAMGG